jgi:hypothetical protein
VCRRCNVGFLIHRHLHTRAVDHMHPMGLRHLLISVSRLSILEPCVPPGRAGAVLSPIIGVLEKVKSQIYHIYHFKLTKGPIPALPTSPIRRHLIKGLGERSTPRCRSSCACQMGYRGPRNPVASTAVFLARRRAGMSRGCCARPPAPQSAASLGKALRDALLA